MGRSFYNDNDIISSESLTKQEEQYFVKINKLQHYDHKLNIRLFPKVHCDKCYFVNGSQYLKKQE